MRRKLVVACILLGIAAPQAGAASLGATQRALDAQMRAAGAYSGAYAVDLDSGETIYDYRGEVTRVPASVEKLYTTTTALIRLGADHTFDTTALADVPVGIDGTLDGDLYLRGAGDPTLSRRPIGKLADQIVADASVSAITGHVVGDESAFDTLRGPPSSHYAISGYVGPLGALMFDRGRTGRARPYWQAHPAAFAATKLAKALRLRGVDVAAKGRAGTAPPGALALATESSPTVARLIRLANVPSDNYVAETLLKGIASASGLGTTARGASIVRSTIGALGVHPSVADGSGLSRSDRTTPRDVVRLLTTLYGEAEGELLRASLAVMGRSGTLEDRLRHSFARGRCQAKTGTLLSVSNLAGYCQTRAGDTIAFAILMNGVHPYSARRLQDRMVSALVRFDG